MSDNASENSATPNDFDGLAADDFASWGVGLAAYIKPAVVEGRAVYAIHDAAGALIGYASDRAAALVAARQSDLEAFSVH
ncbi:MAG: DUF1150 domain-containing protein [Rhodospirillales bacterium]|nr:DUF1150 domain-containing protein [Rhodospirillales bacterium]MCW8862406.1 DUF1150 domain-containing protein [Rhodospirillales bacterium]MCW8951176.1 DUF1150 domain-containing protein [Rhodospirillales bacterium]MCW9001564.1 DUF1150 domain-containing protein [Rhodospirillales bacterium]MCW9039841.1 DUF1150 domain-containing protein [Rhodospirillales bacterium]